MKRGKFGRIMKRELDKQKDLFGHGCQQQDRGKAEEQKREEEEGCRCVVMRGVGGR